MQQTSIFIFTAVYAGFINNERGITSVALAFFNQKFGVQAEHGVFTLPAAYKLPVGKNILSFAHDFTLSVARGLDLRHKMSYYQKRNNDYMLLLLFYRAACEEWQPPMSKEDTRESPLAQKCYWHRIIPEVGGHFDPCTKQGTPTTRRRPP